MNNFTRVCCDEPDEDCSTGYPATCNQDCALEYIPLYQSCSNVAPFNNPEIAPNLEGTFDMCEGARQSGISPSRPTLPPPPPLPANMCDINPSIMNINFDSDNQCQSYCPDWYCHSSGYCED